MEKVNAEKKNTAFFSKMALPAKASVIGAATNLFSRGLSAASTPLFTRLLAPAEYGIYALYLSWFNLLSGIAAPGLSGSALYRGMQKYPNERRCFLLLSLLIYMILPAALSVLPLLFPSAAEKLTGLPPILVLALFAQIFLGAATSILSAEARYRYCFSLNAALNIGFSVIAIGASLVLIRGFGADGIGRIAGNLIGTAAVAIPAFVLLLIGRKSKKTKISFRKWREMLKFLIPFLLPLLPHYLSITLLGQADHILIGRLLGKEALGAYAVAAAIGLAPMMLTMGITSAYQPWLTRKLAAGEPERVRKMNSLLLRCVFPAVLLFLCFLPEGYAFLAPESYAAGFSSVIPLALSVPARLISAILTAALLAKEQTKLLSIPSIAAAMLSVGADSLLLPRYGIFAASLVVLLGQVLLSAGYGAICRAKTKLHLFSIGECLLLFAFAGCFCLLLSVFAGSFPLRLLLAASAAVLLLLQIPQLRHSIGEKAVPRPKIA